MKMSGKYADDINLSCLDLQIRFFSELALSPACITSRAKQTEEHLKFHQTEIEERIFLDILTESTCTCLSLLV